MTAINVLSDVCFCSVSLSTDAETPFTQESHVIVIKVEDGIPATITLPYVTPHSSRFIGLNIRVDPELIMCNWRNSANEAPQCPIISECGVLSLPRTDVSTTSARIVLDSDRLRLRILAVFRAHVDCLTLYHTGNSIDAIVSLTFVDFSRGVILVHSV